MRLKKLLSLLLTLMMVMSVFTMTATTVSAANTGKIKNVIFLIPDGGGMEPFNLADAVKQAGGMNRTMFPYATQQTVNKMYLKDYLVAGMTTHAANSSGPTDSAAAGSAMATGYKTNLYQIGLDSSQKPKANLLEGAQLSGRKTGLVTRYEFAHATPAAFSAHSVNRSDYRMMSEQIVNQGIDVVLSPGLYNGVCGFSDALDTVLNMGYTLINSRYDLQNVKQGDKIWSYMPTYSFDYQNTAASPTLAELTDTAIRALECDEGFFLMVEGSSVDTGGHDNNALEMVGNYIAFDEACKIAIEFAKGRTDTVVMAAPDHDTGGMNIINKSAAVSSIQNGQNPGSNAITWTSKDHTSRNGGVFLYVPSGISYPSGTSSNPGVSSNFNNYTIDNDDLAPYLADCMGFDLDDATDELFVNVSSLGTYTKKYDEESESSNYTGTFKFNNANCTVEANQSYATLNGERVSLDGQVAFYEYYTGKFYVPQKLLNYIDGIEEPDEDATTGGGTAGNNSLITETSITKMGTAATFWGNVSTYEKVTNNDNNSITMQPGGWVTFNVPVANSGIYYLQVKSSGGNATLEMLVNDEYYAEMPVKTAEQNYYLNNGKYEFLYMPAGKVSVKLTNLGASSCTVSDVQLIASKNAVNAGTTPTMSSVKRRAVWLGASQNQVDHYNSYTSGGSYSATIAPGSYIKASVSGLPYDGIYGLQLKLSSVNGTANIRATSGNGYYADYSITETGVWTNRMTPAKDQPIYFSEGNGTLYIENIGSSSFTFQEWDLARMDAGDSLDFKYLLNATTTLPDGTTVTPDLTPGISAQASAWTGRFSDVTSHANGYVGENYAMTTFTKSNGSSSVAGVDYQASSSSPFGTGGAFTMVTGDWGKYEVSVPYTGVYAMQVKASWIAGNGATTMKVSTEDGYYTVHNLTAATWSSGSMADQPIYLKAGKNVITVELVGPNNCTFAAIDFGKLDKNGADASLDYLSLVKYEEPTDEPTTTPTPEQAEWVYAAQDQTGYFNNYAGGTEPNVSLAPGAHTTITVPNLPYSGIYAFQLRLDTISGGTAKVRVITEDGCYADYELTQAATWTNRMTPPKDMPIYLNAGSNTVYIQNIGSSTFYVGDTDCGRLDAGDPSDFEYLLQYGADIPGGTTPTATPTPTTAPTTTPEPTTPPAIGDESEPTVPSEITWENFIANITADSGCTLYSNYMFLSVYEKDTAYVTVKIGAPKTAYYTLESMIDSSNGAHLYGPVTATFDNGEVATHATGSLNGTTDWTPASPSVLLSKGNHTVTFKTADPYSHVYLRGIRLVEDTSIPVPTPTPVDKFTGTDKAYEIAVDNGTVTANLTDLFTAVGPVIQSQDVTVTVEGATVNKVASDWTKSTITFPKAGIYTVTITDNSYCNTATATVSVTQLVSEFKGFTVANSTATVSYTKTNTSNPEAITLYIAEYAGNKLVQINLVPINTTAQTVGTTKEYSVSLPKAATGTVKAMLLDANLVPLF